MIMNIRFSSPDFSFIIKVHSVY